MESAKRESTNEMADLSSELRFLLNVCVEMTKTLGIPEGNKKQRLESTDIPSLDVCDEQDSPTKAMTAAAGNGHVEGVRLLAEVQWADINVLDNGDELV